MQAQFIYEPNSVGASCMAQNYFAVMETPLNNIETIHLVPTF